MKIEDFIASSKDEDEKPSKKVKVIMEKFEEEKEM